MTEIRCVNTWHGHKCNRLLMKEVSQQPVERGVTYSIIPDHNQIEIQCPKCGYKNNFTLNMTGEVFILPLGEKETSPYGVKIVLNR